MHTPVAHSRPEPMRREGCTSENWTEGPWNRWGFSHVRELARTARISRGDGPVWVLPPADPAVAARVAGTVVPHPTGDFSLVDALEAAYTDAFVVVHRGAVALEWYAEGIRPDRTHLVMSVSKSFTSTLIGSLVGDGLVEPEAAVERYVPSLRGTAWEGATVQHLLDMTAGVQFDEDDYDNPQSDGVLIEQVSGYITHQGGTVPPDTETWIRSVPPQGTHGDRYQYRSLITDVLAMIVEEVTGQRFADAFSARIWSRIGPEHDADIIVDAKGFPTVEGGICVTPRDLARLGLLHLQRGTVRGEQVIPASWTDHALEDDGTRRAQFAAANPVRAHEFYKDCWWIIDAARGLYAGHGINGQHVFVDRATDTVIAVQSTWPNRLDFPLVEFSTHIVMQVLAGLE